MTINGYTLTIFKSLRRMEVFTISKDDKELFAIDSKRFFYRHASDKSAFDKVIIPGKNITGGSEPNLVVGDMNCGTGCFYTYRVFSLGKTFKQLATIEVGNNEGAHFTDFDHDGIPEIVMLDYSLAYIWDSFDNTPTPRIVLRYGKDGYKMAPDLMRTPAPKVKAFAAMKKQCLKAQNKEIPTVPAMLRSKMIELINSGHPQLAEHLCREVWPEWDGNRQEFLDNLYQMLEKNPYYNELPWRASNPAQALT